MSVTSDQLEEGEIVDDEFEEISDNSITECTFGKFVSSNEHLRAFSLSSKDDNDSISEKDYKPVKCKKKKLQAQRKTKRKRRHRHHQPDPISGDSTDSDFTSDFSEANSIKDKLKEAVRISHLDAGEKRSLEARLKAMNGLIIDIDAEPSPMPSPPPPPNLHSTEESDSTKIDDNELEMLRLEALKTAFLKKNQQRKKRKLEQQQQKELAELNNKENDTPMAATNQPQEAVSNENKVQEAEVKKSAQNEDMEEDEDLLRASLLAGLAKKITKMQEQPLAVAQPQQHQLKPGTVAANVVKIVQPIVAIKKNTYHKTIMPKSQVKPLIIKLQSDSDSTDEPMETSSRDNSFGEAPKAEEELKKSLSTTVEQFLKEQRAKFEIEREKKLKNGENKNKLLQISNNNSSSNSTTVLEKSAVKLLPKSQQLEYQQLLKRLKTAEKEIKLKKLQQKKLSVAKTENGKKLEAANVQKRGNNAEISATATTKIVNLPLDKEITAEKLNIEAEKKRPGLTSELTNLRRTLREVRTQKNGSLQIKSKYQRLTPIMKKITETSQERRKYEDKIRLLLQQLSETRTNLAKSHEKFSILVRELVSTKQVIDKSTEKKSSAPSPPTKPSDNKMVEKSDEQVIDQKNASNTDLLLQNNEIGSPLITSTPLKQASHPVSLAVEEIQNNQVEDMDVCNTSDETTIIETNSMCQIDIVDPNDIDQIFTMRRQQQQQLENIKQHEVAVPSSIKCFPEYVSPLNINSNRYGNVDPLAIMCPYEVNGLCRDLDCTFKHYLKK